MPVATVVIPYAAYHSELVKRANASAARQTVPCKIMTMFDEKGLGPAWVRNRAVKYGVDTDFVCFLDADDTLSPTFLEDCLNAYEDDRYVYTNWKDGDTLWKPKPFPWSPDSHHIVTTLYPTAIFKALGGFDETMAGHEDADFYMRSYAAGICGIHLDKALVLRPDDTGLRSKLFHQRPDYEETLRKTYEKYGGEKLMGCCGAPGVPVPNNPGAEQPGDVKAQTLWNGTRSEYSPFSGRIYVGGNGDVLNVAPQDVEKLKNAQGAPLFKLVADLRELAPKREIVLKTAGLT